MLPGGSAVGFFRALTAEAAAAIEGGTSRRVIGAPDIERGFRFRPLRFDRPEGCPFLRVLVAPVERGLVSSATARSNACGPLAARRART